MRSLRHPLLSGLVLISVALTSACGSLPSLPGNPFGSAPTATPAPRPAAPSPEPAAPAFSPFWVKNHRPAEMWSGPAGQQGVSSFGVTSQQFCSFMVVLPPENARLYVFNPYSGNYLWIDADAVGPVGAPERQSGPKPADQNCAGVVYEG